MDNPFFYFTFMFLFTGIGLGVWIHWHSTLKDNAYHAVIKYFKPIFLWGVVMVFVLIGLFFGYLSLFDN